MTGFETILHFIVRYVTWTNLGLFTLAAPVLLWLIFVPLYWILGRAQKWSDLHPAQRAISIALFLVGAPIDVWVNLTWGTVMFLQPPNYQRLFLSARMDDLIRSGTGWRKALALQIVGRLLEPFDKTGQHNTYGEFK